MLSIAERVVPTVPMTTLWIALAIGAAGPE